MAARKVYNLATDEMRSFDQMTTPEYALAYCQAQIEEVEREFFEVSLAARAVLWRALPFVYGKYSVGLGDLATRRD